MKVKFLGVGEAFDKNNPNTSIIVMSNSNILLDCGYSIPHQLWKYNSNPNFLDAIYISHSHADHYFGLPSILAKMQIDKREKPLTIICQKEIKRKIKKMMELAYKGFYKIIEFQINYLIVKENKESNFQNLKLSFAKSIHSISNFAIKIQDKVNDKTICYSGDGMYSNNSKKLFQNCDLLIHESFLFDKEEQGHGNIVNVVKMSKELNVKSLALVHINGNLRKDNLKKLNEYCSKQDIKIIIPESFDEVEV